MHKIRSFLYFLKTIYQQRYVVRKLVARDFQNKYLASYLGLPWAFIQPLMSILVIWFAFTYGLRMGVMESGLPFTVWFICGMVPWLFISDTVISSTNSLLEYSYLIKKTAFRVAVIPFTKIFTALIIHLFFVILLVVLVLANGFKPSIYWLQILYLIPAIFILLTGLGWLLSSINVFVRDMGMVVNVVMSILFWATPILWPYEILQGNMKYLALLNPFFYIIEGYRYAFLGQSWMFMNLEMTLYFWTITTIIFIAGALIFHRLRPHFADVL